MATPSTEVPAARSGSTKRPDQGRGRYELREAVGVGRGVSAFQPHLMRSLVAEVDEEVGVEAHPPLGVDVQLGHPALDALGIELGVPGQVERIGEVDAPAVAADLDHLRAAVELSAHGGMTLAADDAADAY